MAIWRPFETYFRLFSSFLLVCSLTCPRRGGFILPALLVTSVFIVGKTFIDTVATLIAEHIGNTPARVGFGMPQMGEFSLAMVKEGGDHGAIGKFMYPVMAISVALTALVYPLVFRSADGFTRFLSGVLPSFVKRYLFLATNWMESARAAFNLSNPVGDQIRDSAKLLVANAGIVVVMIAVGTFALSYAQPLSSTFGVSEGLMGLTVTILVVVFSVPPCVFIWRSLQRTIDVVAEVRLGSGNLFNAAWAQTLRAILRDAFLFTLVVLLIIFSLPFLSGLLALGRFVAPIPILIFVAIIAGAWRLVSRLHRSMEDAFRFAFLDASEDEPESH